MYGYLGKLHILIEFNGKNKNDALKQHSSCSKLYFCSLFRESCGQNH